MKIFLAILCVISMAPLNVAQSGVFAGLKAQKGPLLNPVFGLEKFINGKKEAYEHQQWTLSCVEQTSKSSQTQTDCSLERWLILDAENKGPGAHISVIQHSTSAGNLVVEQANWNGGQWKLKVLYKEGGSLDVRFLLDAHRADYFVITSFEAVGKVPAGVLTYRIPETTYFLKTAIKMTGMNEK